MITHQNHESQRIKEEKWKKKKPKSKQETTEVKEGTLPFWVWPVVYQQ